MYIYNSPELCSFSAVVGRVQRTVKDKLGVWKEERNHERSGELLHLVASKSHHTSWQKASLLKNVLLTLEHNREVTLPEYVVHL